MIYLAALIVIGLGIVIIYLQTKVIRLEDRLRDLKSDVNNLSYPGSSIIQSATKKAQEILTEAEKQSLALPIEKSIEGNLFQVEFDRKVNLHLESLNKSLEANFSDFKQHLENSLVQNQQKHDLYLDELAKKTLSFESSTETQIQSKVEALLLNFEQKMTDFFANAQTKSLEAINLEISSSRQLIESYKSQQLNLIDENIVAVLERTLSIVLNQKMTLRDQLDLVYEALEKAKIEKFLV